MDDQDKPKFSEARRRKLQRHLDGQRRAAEKEAAANTKREEEEAARQKRRSKEKSKNTAAQKAEVPNNDQNKPTSQPSSSSRPSSSRHESANESSQTPPTDAGNNGPPRPPVPRPKGSADSPPPSPTWRELSAVAGFRSAAFLFSQIRSTWNAFSLHNLLQVWDLTLQTGRLVFVLLTILIFTLISNQVFPAPINQALTTCSKTSLPILAPVCGAIKVALPEFTQDQTDDPSHGKLPQLLVHAGLLGRIAARMQKDVAYAITSTAFTSTEGVDEVDSVLDDATLSISEHLYQLERQLDKLRASSSVEPGWGSAIRQFLYIEESNVNQVLRIANEIRHISHVARENRLKVGTRLEAGAISIDHMYRTLCLWNNELNRYGTSKQDNLKHLQERLKYHHSTEWFWSHVGGNHVEDPEALQDAIDDQEIQLRVLQDAALRAKYGCIGFRSRETE
ncbi:hypothetical protein CEP54_014803 [Fusarium duplospermum]|uniref:Uncharacterized protein n=1 Tax=Fusarium duplospermum TaxID=1325734 RepID=A0A428NTR1_9HYPO|nr:hypothetical protein CEP54_014803 [Fusarium duplospermum]